jgi:GPH family glycoside/pentoside/hexuronide:cation symporter
VTLFFLLLTALAVPYRALGPELVRDFDARNALFGVREGLFVVGSALAMAAPAAIGALLHTTSDRTRFAVFAAVAAPLLVIAAAVCLVFVREPRLAPVSRSATMRASAQLQARAGPFGGLRQRPFAVLLGAYTVAALGNNLPGALATYYATYVLGVENVGLYLVAFLGAGLAALPLWTLAARRFGKKEAWLAALAVNTVPFAFVLRLERGDTRLFAVLIVLSGFGAIATVALAPSMQADAIDHDELQTGERRDGQLIGLWMIAEKLAAALGVGVALPLLGAVGYVPNTAQSPQVLLTLRVLYIVVPCVCNALAFIILLGYPLDRRAHAKVVEALARKRTEAEAP